MDPYSGPPKRMENANHVTLNFLIASLPPYCTSRNRNEVKYSAELQTWPRRSPNSSIYHHLARIPTREEGMTNSTSYIPVISSGCLQECQLRLYPLTPIPASLQVLAVLGVAGLWPQLHLTKRLTAPEPASLLALTDGSQNSLDQMILFPSTHAWEQSMD